MPRGKPKLKPNGSEKRRGRGPGKPKLDLLAAQEQRLKECHMMSLHGLATLIGVSARTLYYKDPKDLPPYSQVGGKRLFLEADVFDWLKKKKNRH